MKSKVARSASPAPARLGERVEKVLVELRGAASTRVRDGMARYGIPADHALGVPINQIQRLGKRLGRDHALAEGLWATGIYEARLLVAYVAEPARLTRAQMDRWCRDFDSWAVVDTVCFALFCDSPLAWSRVEPWAKNESEFVRRAGFALLACLSGPKKPGDDAAFLTGLQLIERGAGDGRNFVKKGVSWALRMIGRRNVVLHAAALATAETLTESTDTAARWIGRTALKDLSRPLVVRRVEKERQ